MQTHGSLCKVILMQLSRLNTTPSKDSFISMQRETPWCLKLRQTQHETHSWTHSFHANSRLDTFISMQGHNHHAKTQLSMQLSARHIHFHTRTYSSCKDSLSMQLSTRHIHFHTRTHSSCKDSLTLHATLG